jgi:hypothetical protein
MNATEERDIEMKRARRLEQALKDIIRHIAVTTDGANVCLLTVEHIAKRGLGE